MKPNLPNITIIEQIGTGASGIVFRAKDDLTGKDLAVKSVTRETVLKMREHAPSPQRGDTSRHEIHEHDPLHEHGVNIRKVMRSCFARVSNEWRLGYRLTNLAGGNVGIPRMHMLRRERDLFLRTRGLHLVMDFVEGVSLRARRDYPLSKMIDIYRQAAHILRFMHRNNVIHADMKPQHIIVCSDGRVQLVDLSLACRRKGHMSRFVGSLNYMAPEQIAGAGVDDSTDVFGLGATMFWALTGRTIRRSVGGAVAMVMMHRQMMSMPLETSVRKYNPNVSPALEEIVLRSCAPSRRGRLTLTDVIHRLDRLA